MSTPLVEVIVPAYNEEDVIADCLESLMQQDYANFKVSIIDDASTDSTAKIIKSFEQKTQGKIRYLTYGKVGPGKARNLTAYKSDAEIFAFTDADCRVSPNWLHELVVAFSDEKTGSVGGPQLAHPSSNAFQLQLEHFLNVLQPIMDFYKKGGEAIAETAHNPLCNVAYRREVFMRLRGFREDLFPGEDLEMDQRVKKEGYKIMFNPKAVVFHHRPADAQQWQKVMQAYGRAQGKLVREKGFHRVMHFLALFGLVLALAMTIAAIDFDRIIGSGVSAIAWIFILFFRPKVNGYWGIFWNSFQWLNGFAEGFFTNRSDPPGGPPRSS